MCYGREGKDSGKQARLARVWRLKEFSSFAILMSFKSEIGRNPRAKKFDNGWMIYFDSASASSGLPSTLCGGAPVTAQSESLCIQKNIRA